MDTNKLKFLFNKKRKPKLEFSDKLKKIKKESNYDEDLELAIALSKSLEISNNESINFIKNNIGNDQSQITQIHDLDQQIKKQISSLGGNKVLENEGGGNCLFLSMATHLNIPYDQLREDSVNYITSSWNRFQDFALNPDTLLPFNNADDYQKYMSKDGSWGDHLSLLSLCELYQVNAILVTTDGKNLQEPIIINVGSKINVLIKFSSEIHYEAII